MRNSYSLALFVLACGPSGGGTTDGSVPDAPVQDAFGDAGDNGCNEANGQGCRCGPMQFCPQSFDQCVVVSNDAGGNLGGEFCTPPCSAATESTDCALAAGQPGMGSCILGLQTLDGGIIMYCGILCGPDRSCPAGFAAFDYDGACVCLAP